MSLYLSVSLSDAVSGFTRREVLCVCVGLSAYCMSLRMYLYLSLGVSVSVFLPISASVSVSVFVSPTVSYLYFCSLSLPLSLSGVPVSLYLCLCLSVSLVSLSASGSGGKKSLLRAGTRGGDRPALTWRGSFPGRRWRLWAGGKRQSAQGGQGLAGRPFLGQALPLPAPGSWLAFFLYIFRMNSLSLGLPGPEHWGEGPASL